MAKLTFSILTSPPTEKWICYQFSIGILCRTGQNALPTLLMCGTFSGNTYGTISLSQLQGDPFFGRNLQEPIIPTAQKTLQRKFPNVEVNKWKKIYMLHRKVTKHTYSRNFQYKILNNILYLNNRLALFGKSPTTKCSFCNSFEETADHLFVECSHSKSLWQGLINNFSQFLTFPTLNSQSAHLGYLDEKIPNFLLLNHILLIFKIYVYNCRDAKQLSLTGLLARIEKIFNLEMKTQEYNRSDTQYEIKWRCIANTFNPWATDLYGTNKHLSVEAAWP